MHAIVADERTQVMGRQVHPATVAAAQQDPIGPAAVDGLQAFAGQGDIHDETGHGAPRLNEPRQLATNHAVECHARTCASMDGPSPSPPAPFRVGRRARGALRRS